MKVLALSGSPRKKGNTETLLGAVLKGVEAAGGEIELIRLYDLRIQPCIGCGGCDKTGECVLEDDMQELYPKILASQRVILASPIYFYGITAQAKAFVDRCQALWNRKRLQKEKGVWHNDSSRKGFLVAVAATHGEKVFDGAILTAKYAFDAMGMEYGGEFVVKGMDNRGEMARDEDTLARAEQAGRKFMD
ncbi:MAG TPA: flavodoxin [Desulfobulbaceae bacterium]|nr:MAG: flavodoxin [Deltaproteobacteria bacterium RIFOXYD12_FULL_53_23]HCC53919.1 flavodoxin [Desulfobulbaceae bacterium]